MDPVMAFVLVYNGLCVKNTAIPVYTLEGIPSSNYKIQRDDMTVITNRRKTGLTARTSQYTA